MLKLILTTILLLISTNLVIASEVTDNGITYQYDEEFSYQDLTGQDLSDQVLDGMIVYGSCFSHEKPDSHIFPEDMRGVTFVNCNLDNVYVPAGNTIIGGSHRRFQAQDDGRDWLLDENNNPVSPL